MPITPQDVQAIKFKKKMGGYNAQEVDEYLDQVADSIQELTQENEDLKKKLSMAGEQLTYLKNLEQTLRDTLITAQRSADETVRNAQKKSESIIRTAEEQGEEIKKKARDEASAVTRNLDTLRVQAQTYARQFRSLMNAQLRLLNENGLGETASEAAAEQKNEKEKEKE